ncbi:hypothetical protein ACU8KH_03003 [Lachancea thermotolerans]
MSTKLETRQPLYCVVQLMNFLVSFSNSDLCRSRGILAFFFKAPSNWDITADPDRSSKSAGHSHYTRPFSPPMRNLSFIYPWRLSSAELRVQIKSFDRKKGMRTFENPMSHTTEVGSKLNSTHKHKRLLTPSLGSRVLLSISNMVAPLEIAGCLCEKAPAALKNSIANAAFDTQY